MKIRIKTLAQIKDILGSDSFLGYSDGTSMREPSYITLQKSW